MERNEYFTYLRKYQEYEKNPNYLCHHGIKGQKWGVRRFQNEDGTLTEEGRRRYGKLYDENDHLTTEGREVMRKRQSGWETASTVAKVIKYIRLGQTGLLVPYTGVMCATAGPVGLVAGGLAIGASLGMMAIDSAISKSCARRADTYYDLLSNSK